jgi:23S rRNA pseudouridine1911/1915/1917 synthase
LNKTINITTDFEGQRLDKALSTLLGLSREKVKKLTLKGSVVLEERAINDPSFQVKEGMVFEVRDTLEEPPLSYKGENIPLTIIFEDDHLLVLDKPAGMVVHPGAGNHSGTLVHALLHHCGSNLSTLGEGDRPGIVHRLDKETSGLMVVAKTNDAHQGLVSQFDDRSLSRCYLAFVEGVPSPTAGTIDKNIGRSDINRKKMAVFDFKGKSAITDYETRETFVVGRALFGSLVECRLQTGRTHQIRVHMASIGHPVIGDPNYGRQKKKAILKRLMEERSCEHWTNERQALHAYKLQFIHPITQESLSFESPLPEDLKELHDILLCN